MVIGSVLHCDGSAGSLILVNAEDWVRRVSETGWSSGCESQLTVYDGTSGREANSLSSSSSLSLNSYGKKVSICGHSFRISFLISIVVDWTDELQWCIVRSGHA